MGRAEREGQRLPIRTRVSLARELGSFLNGIWGHRRILNRGVTYSRVHPEDFWGRGVGCRVKVGGQRATGT